MSNVSLEAYLFFKGNCREAMEFYKGVFGGELVMNTYETTGTTDPSKKDWIIHANLSGGDAKLMASDSEEASNKAAKVELSLGGTDEAKMRKIFDALSDGGNVKMPLEKQFWGDVYGTFTDKFGIDWSMNIGAMSAN